MKLFNKKTTSLLSGILTLSIIASIAITSISSHADETTNNYKSVKRDTKVSVDENGVLNITRTTKQEEKIMGKEDTWTLFVYMTGSNLESEYECASNDIQEMLKANFTEENIDKVNVIIQTGGSKDWHSNRICDDMIERHKVDTNSIQLTNLSRSKNASMGDPNTLYDFLDWGITNYPAEHMGIVFWNHGSGVERGLCFDENYDDDSLSVHELEYVFAKLNKKMTSKFELVGFDTCLTGSLEYANLLAPYAKYMVGSADVAIAKGWYYTTIINYLLENPDATGAEVGPVICDDTTKFLEDFYTKNPVNYSMALYDLSKVDNVCIETNYLAKFLYDTLINDPDGYKNLASFRNSRLTFEHECIDIGSILYYFENESPYNYDTTHFRNALNELILHCNFRNKFDNQKSAIGITLFIPNDAFTIQTLNTYRNVCFSPYLLKYLDYMNTRYINKDISKFMPIEWDKSPYFFEENFDFLNYDTDYSKDKNINEQTVEKLLQNPDYADDGFPNSWYNNVTYNKDSAKRVNSMLNKRNFKTYDSEYTLADGQKLTAYTLAQNETTTLLSFPVLINEKECSIRVEKTTTENGQITYTTLGLWDTNDSPYNTDKIARGYLPLNPGTVIKPIYDNYNATTDEYYTTYGEAFTITEDSFL